MRPNIYYLQILVNNPHIQVNLKDNDEYPIYLGNIHNKQWDIGIFKVKIIVYQIVPFLVYLLHPI